jgi:tetratricopeptide (TPR) repeat protein
MRIKKKSDLHVKEIERIENLIQEGKIDEALDIIDELESKEDLEEINLIKSQVLKSIIFIQKEDCEEGLKLAEQALKKAKELGKPFITLDAIIAKAKAMLSFGEIDGCLDVIEEGEEPLKMVEQDKGEKLTEKKAKIYQIKGIAHRNKGDLDIALELVKNSLSISEKRDDKFEIAGSLNNIGIIHALKGQFDLAIKYIQQSMKVYEELGFKHHTIKILNNFGLIHAYNGELDQALKYCHDGLNLSEKEGKEQSIAALYLNIGIIYINKGDLILALDFTKKSLAKYEELENKREKAVCQNNIGIIHQMKGELDIALELHTRSITIFEELGNNHELAMCYSNIGNCYQLKGDVDKASFYYEKSMKLLEEIGNNLDTSITLLNLISVDLQRGMLESSSTYLQRLQEFNDKEKNKVINQIYRLAKAIILKTSERVFKRAEAQQLFQEISVEEITQFEHVITAKKNFCELLIQELQTSGNEEILREIKELLQQLLTIAENQQSHSLFAEIYLIQSKIALLELDITLARQLLSQAQQIAEEKGLQGLLMVISREYDSLLNQSSKLSELADTDVPMAKRLELAELESMVTRMVRKKADILEISEEEPIIFLILVKSGMSIFSKQFVSKSLLADQLIGGFLTAINAFSREAFSESGSIEGIKHEEYTLLMKPMESLLCCYVFKGQSYFALQKLKNFAETAKVSDVVKDILAEAESIGLDVSEEALVVDLVTKTFLSTPDELPKSVSYGFFSQKVTATIKHGIYL